MCEFCTQHGDGKKWYLEASNYASDLEHDLERRGYMIEFVTGFDRNMTRNIRLLDRMKASPKPVRTVVRTVAARSQKLLSNPTVSPAGRLPLPLPLAK